MNLENAIQTITKRGFTDRQARFLVLVARHSGVCVMRQYSSFAGIVFGQKTREFFAKLMRLGFVSTYDCAHNRGRIYHVRHRAILDDPVQSMDEVHVSQFAALLRALSKNHGRQIVIAVHDRALFDYLALELSPAFPDDQLLTLELGRSDSGASLAEPVFRLWQPEKALAVS